jgi:HSP90 family molecular chaperone
MINGIYFINAYSMVSAKSSPLIEKLVQNGYEVISADNNSRSTPGMLEGIEKITGKKIKNYKMIIF